MIGRLPTIENGIAEADPPKVILMDIAMPGMSGIQTLKELRRRQAMARMREEARRWAASHTWERSASRLVSVVSREPTLAGSAGRKAAL
jgi:CheY-like chemotaxis protein